uniref:Bm553 n=1 Tax=Brugia malayi TaxID=6279 RepID=A0A0H5S8B2_BRUMA|nr:Bm553 [Brugia malayi]
MPLLTKSEPFYSITMSSDRLKRKEIRTLKQRWIM